MHITYHNFHFSEHVSQVEQQVESTPLAFPVESHITHRRQYLHHVIAFIIIYLSK